MEAETKAIHEENFSLLAGFKAVLRSRNMAGPALDQHETNVDFYINHYLLYSQPTSAIEGVSCDLVRDFLGNFFVHKAMWTDVEEQKASIESILLFYEWLAGLARIPEQAVADLRVMIAAERESWFATMERNTEESLESWQGETEIEFFDELPINEPDENLDEIDESFMSELDALKIPVGDSETPKDEHNDEEFGELEDLDEKAANK